MNLIEISFEWLLATTLRASALAAVILGLQFLLRRWLPAGWRHALWLPMLAVLVLPVLPTAPFGLIPSIEVKPAPAVPMAAAPVVPAPVVVETAAPALAAAPVVAPMLPEAEELAPATAAAAAPAPTPARNVEAARHTVAPMSLLALVWFTVACGVLAAGLIGYLRTMRKILSGGVSPDAKLQAAINSAAREAGLRHVPRVCISPLVSSPAVTGFIRPLLLLPAGFPRGFQAGEARLVLLHEFTHLKRLDLPLNWLACVLQAMHWFNPLLWYAFARMRADRELACDARVLSIDAADHRAEYGGALLKLQCAVPPRALSLGFIGIFERGSEIKSRIRGISSHRPARTAGKLTGAALLTLLLAFGVTKAQEAVQPATDRKTSPEVDPALPINEAARQKILEKLNSIILPSLQFEDVSLGDAVEFLRIRSAELDTTETDARKKGINFVVLAPAADTKISELNLRNVSIGRVLQYICEITSFRYAVDDSAVTLKPRDAVKPSGASIDALIKQVAEQEKKVEDRRKVLFTIVRSNDLYHDLEQERKELEIQLNSLNACEGDELIKRASLLPQDTIIRHLYPEYLEVKRQSDGARNKGLGNNHPMVLALANQLEASKRQLDKEVDNLRANLEARLGQVGDRLKDAAREEAINRHQYQEAKAEFETEQELLQQLKLKLMSEEMEKAKGE